jgi:hypothetical protein
MDRKKPQVLFDFAQGRLSTSLRFHGKPGPAGGQFRLKLDDFTRIYKVIAAPTASRGRQDDKSVGVSTKNALNKLADHSVEEQL